MTDTDYCKTIKITQLITLNGCSAINNKVIDAKLYLDDGGKIITIENPDNQLKAITMVPTLPHGTYNFNGEDVDFQSSKTWLWSTENGLSIQLR